MKLAPNQLLEGIRRELPERILAEEVAKRLETINYEVTCGISQRVPREFRE